MKVHIALHTNAAGATVRLTKLAHTGKGRTRGWTIGRADVDGRVLAVARSTYAFTYTVRDASGRTVQATATIVVGR